MAQILDCIHEVSEFEHQSHNNVLFWANTLEKVMIGLTFPGMALIVLLLLFSKKDHFAIK